MKEILQKETIQTFLKVAREFIDIVENCTIRKDFYINSHKCLINLYSAGHELERIDIKYATVETEFKEIEDEILGKKNIDFLAILGQDCFYWEIFDPTYAEQDGKPKSGWQITDKETTQGWLIDDYSDIYRDIKRELYKIDNIGTNEAIEDGLWQLRFGFYHHWGNHCINALRYLHYLHYDGKELI